MMEFERTEMEVEKEKIKEKGGHKMGDNTDMLAAQLAAQRNAGGCGDGFGLGGGGLLGGIVLGSLLGGRGFLGRDGVDGGRCGCGGCGCNNCCTEMLEMHDDHINHDFINLNDSVNSRFNEISGQIQHGEILGGIGELGEKICNVDRDVLEAKFANAIQGKDLIHAIDMQGCAIERNVDSVKFNQQIIAKESAMQLADCCCKLEKLTIKEAQKTRDLIRDNREEDLENEIQELRFEKRQKETSDTILANFGTMITTLTNSLNSTAVG